MTPQQFRDFAAQGFNRIPVTTEVLADLDTPLSTYLKLADAPYTYLLESVQGGEKWGRYSIIGLPCRTVYRVRGSHIAIERDGGTVQTIEQEDPLAWLDARLAEVRSPEVEGLPRFTGGLVGYFGYDTVRYIEPRLGPCRAADPLDVPDIMLMISDEVVVFDNLRGRLYVVVYADPAADDAHEAASARCEAIADGLERGLPTRQLSPAQAVDETDFVSGFTREGFEAAVRRIKDYIVAGDVMQVVPSQRLSVRFDAEPLDLYRALRSLNPSPYLYYLHMGDFHIVGSSPEILVHMADGNVTVRPIAGTRRRGATAEEDRELERDLLADPKELAEHLMLIDLGRNDVGRVSEIGSVQVTEQMVIERYSHVMHIVSNVTGRMLPGMRALDALRATFPAGTLSGAPRIRAMEIVDELEPVKRGVYGGAVGYVGWNGAMDTAIAIRTAVIKDGQLHVQAGAGIVADSVPATEWEETMSKGRAIFRAAAIAQAGLGRRGD